jgi:hypothetical protein
MGAEPSLRERVTLGLFDTHRVSRHHVLDLEYAGFM